MTAGQKAKRVLILGADGRDFRNFNTVSAILRRSPPSAAVGDIAEIFRQHPTSAPVVRASYELAEVGVPRLSALIADFLSGRSI